MGFFHKDDKPPASVSRKRLAPKPSFEAPASASVAALSIRKRLAPSPTKPAASSEPVKGNHPLPFKPDGYGGNTFATIPWTQRPRPNPEKLFRNVQDACLQMQRMTTHSGNFIWAGLMLDVAEWLTAITRPGRLPNTVLRDLGLLDDKMQPIKLD